ISLQSFQITREVGSWIKIDEGRREWYIPDGFAGGTKHPRIHSFDEILGYELLEDGDSITKGGLGRAVAGGLLFGGVGAIVGGATGKRKTKATCTSLKIKITLNDITMPIEYINLITTETKKSGFLYKTCQTQAQEVMSILQVICDSSKAVPQSDTVIEQVEKVSAADEIMKFKQLLDAGVITEEEFKEQKRKLLELQ
ncbi:MAG: SHOCT domain-containing protein, partial [Bacteroidales bacterium]|nr:SHOCT domain-containing protein [Bacteroidales bacterium]